MTVLPRAGGDVLHARAHKLEDRCRQRPRRDSGSPRAQGPCNRLACPPVLRGVRQADRAREDQFRAYVLQSRGRLLRTAMLLASGNAHEAEDLVQTVLLRMYVSWHRI